MWVCVYYTQNIFKIFNFKLLTISYTINLFSSFYGKSILTRMLITIIYYDINYSIIIINKCEVFDKNTFNQCCISNKKLY
jgi:hypothetical protein